MSIVFICTLTGCYSTSEYRIQQEKAAKELPSYEQALINANCFDLRFKFTNRMPFSKDDALNSLKCLEIEKTRNALRWKARGVIEEDELAAKYAYENNKSVFSYLARGEITLVKAHEIHQFADRKSRIDAQTEIKSSNQMLAQEAANRRREWELANREREIYLQNMRRNAPIITTCNGDGFSVRCTTN